MIPYLLAIAGGYLIGSGLKSKTTFAKGGSVAKNEGWNIPSMPQLKQEFRIEHELKGNNFFDSEEEFLQSIKNGKVITVTPEMDSKIRYRSRTKSKEELLDLIKSYSSYPKYRNEETIQALYDAFKTNQDIDLPIIIEFKDGSKRVLSGNTRMDIAFQSGVNPKVLLIKSRYAKGGSTLLAPNGKPSNLTPEQYRLVRTPEFKAWFGDWENDPENASKVVDENGEPLICYHGGGIKNVFDKNYIGITDEGWYGHGFYFSPSTKIPSLYGNTKPYFIVIKKIFNVNKENPFYSNPKESTDLYIKRGFDGSCKTLDVSKDYHEYCVFYPFNNQIKLADGSNTTFDGSNPDIRYAKGGIS